MNTKRQIIRKQGQEIDRLECENIALKRKLKDGAEEITRLRNSLTEARLECIDYGNVSKKLIKTEEERLKLERTLKGYQSELAAAHGELDRSNKIIDNLKQQCKEMHRVKASAIGWKREAAVSKRGFNNLMATYAESEKDNNDLSRGLSNALGKVEVFERVLGELPEAAQPEPKTQGE